jgi:hypothetical protein
MTTEIDRLMQLAAKFPALAKAIVSTQTTFDDEAEPTDADMLFITRVTDSPVQVEGRLAPTAYVGSAAITSPSTPSTKPPPKPPSPKRPTTKCSSWSTESARR